MKKMTLILLATWFGSLAACDNDPGAGKPVAEVAEPAANPKEAPNAPDTAQKATQGKPDEAGVVYIFDNSNSDLDFVGAKVTGKHEGDFKKFAGEITVPDGKLERGAVEVTVQMASVETDEEKLTKHLKSADFFDAEKYPEARFVSTRVEAAPGPDGATHQVTGNLTLHGVTKAIRFPAKITLHEERVEVSSSFVLDRKDFGIVYPGMPDDMIKDEVALTLALEAMPKE